MSDDSARIISPDPKIRITTTGGVGSVTFQVVGTPQIWQYSINGGTSWTDYESEISVTSTATVEVRDGTKTYTHADMVGVKSVGRQELSSSTATFTLSDRDYTDGDELHVLLDAIAPHVGGYASGWSLQDNAKNNHVTEIKHPLGRVPNTLLVWFCPNPVGPDPDSRQYPVIWPWDNDYSINPVSIRADKDAVYLSISGHYSPNLHGVWPKASNPSDYNWQKYDTGYWRIVVS